MLLSILGHPPPDIKNPLVLRQMDRIAAMAARQPGVSTIQSIVEPMVLASEALYGQSQIPDEIQMTRAMSALMEGDPNLRVLVDPQWTHALIHVKVRGAYTAEALGMVERLEGPAGAGLRGERAGIRRSAMSEEMLAKDEENQKKDEENREMRAELARLRAQVAPAEGVPEV